MTALDAHLEVSLREIMFAEPGSAAGALIHQTTYTQPALFAIGAAMHAVFVEAGITPDYLFGHSIGELTAAYIAGVFSLADAAVLVTARGRLMQACPPGAMIGLSRPTNARWRPSSRITQGSYRRGQRAHLGRCLRGSRRARTDHATTAPRTVFEPAPCRSVTPSTRR